MISPLNWVFEQSPSNKSLNHSSGFFFFFLSFWLLWVFVAVWGLLFIRVQRLLIAMASLAVEHGIWWDSGSSSYLSRALEHGLSPCGTGA